MSSSSNKKAKKESFCKPQENRCTFFRKISATTMAQCKKCKRVGSLCNAHHKMKVKKTTSAGQAACVVRQSSRSKSKSTSNRRKSATYTIKPAPRSRSRSRSRSKQTKSNSTKSSQSKSGSKSRSRSQSSSWGKIISVKLKSRSKSKNKSKSKTPSKNNKGGVKKGQVIIAPADLRCTHKNKKQVQCKKWKKSGSYCKTHAKVHSNQSRVESRGKSRSKSHNKTHNKSRSESRTNSKSTSSWGSDLIDDDETDNHGHLTLTQLIAMAQENDPLDKAFIGATSRAWTQKDLDRSHQKMDQITAEITTLHKDMTENKMELDILAGRRKVLTQALLEGHLTKTIDQLRMELKQVKTEYNKAHGRNQTFLRDAEKLDLDVISLKQTINGHRKHLNLSPLYNLSDVLAISNSLMADAQLKSKEKRAKIRAENRRLGGSMSSSRGSRSRS